jgi:hypothetical protein
MRNIQAGSGRLFSATVEGPRPTLRDTMVAASVYAAHLEEAIPDAAELIACFCAWQQEVRPNRDGYSYVDSDRSLRWQKAHNAAEHAGRAWLSNPMQQTFRFQLHPAATSTGQPLPAYGQNSSPRRECASRAADDHFRPPTTIVP